MTEDTPFQDRIAALERRTETLSGATAHLVEVTRALTFIVANLRHQAAPQTFDPRLPDIEKDLDEISATLKAD